MRLTTKKFRKNNERMNRELLETLTLLRLAFESQAKDIDIKKLSR